MKKGKRKENKKGERKGKTMKENGFSHGELAHEREEQNEKTSSWLPVFWKKGLLNENAISQIILPFSTRPLALEHHQDGLVFAEETKSIW